MPQDALQSVLTEAGLALSPLRAVNTPQKAVDLFKKLGYDLPASAVGSALSGVATEGTELVNCCALLVDASGDMEVIAALGSRRYKVWYVWLMPL